MKKSWTRSGGWGVCWALGVAASAGAARASAGAASAGAGSAGAASAGERLIAVGCPDWSPGARAEVEARVRAALLTEMDPFVRVAVDCDLEGSIRVTLETLQGALARAVEQRTARRVDDVVATVDALLGEREQLRAATTPPARGSSAATAPGGSAATAPGGSAAAPLNARASDPHPRPAPPSGSPSPKTAGVSDFVTRVGVSTEIWRDHAALGADLALGPQRGAFGWALAIGAANVFGAPTTFDAQEWHGQAQFSVTLSQFAGLQLAADAGLSLLVVTPHANVRSTSATLLSTASFSLAIARPFWLGAFAIAPDVGLRLFASDRSVRTDDRNELRIPLLVPRAGIWLLYSGG